MLALVSQTQSVLNIVIAAAISTALFAFGLRGQSVDRNGQRRRVRRWPSLLGGLLGAAMSVVVALADDVRPWEAGAGDAIALGVGAVVAIAGAVLLCVGLRGRRVGDHPYCRACGFDLFGRPSGSLVCNECGASLVDDPKTTRPATVVGVKQRRMMPLTIGLFVMIVAVAISVPTGTRAVRWARSHDWDWLLPESSLMMPNGAPVSILQEREICRRLAAGTLSEGATRRYIDRGLNAPNTVPPRPFTRAAMIQWAARAWANGRLDEATTRRAMIAALDFSFDPAIDAAAGHVLRYHLVPTYSPFNSPYWLRSTGLALQVHDRHDAFNGSPVPADRLFSSKLDDQAASPSELPDQPNATRLDALPLGPARYDVAFTATLTLSAPGRPVLVESADVALTGTTTIVPEAARVCPPVKAV